MANSSSQEPDLASSVSKLSVQPAPKNPSKTPKTKNEVADSWEEEDVSSEPEDEATHPATADKDASGGSGTSAPPPTPISPSYAPSRQFSAVDSSTFSTTTQPDDSDGQTRRPEKTDAVARRMIASALGVKVPKLTEEQKAYERAMKENERKRRDEERAATKRKQAEAEKAKAAIWED